jgi:hexokinase
MASEAPDTSSFHLTQEQLGAVREALAAKIRAGLDRPGTELAALPSYYAAPDRALQGTALVLDTGGTNMRAAVVELSPGGQSKIVRGPMKKRLTVRETNMTASEFFAAQAALAVELGAPRGLPVGYCFSYPAENTPDKDSRLLKWTKNVQVLDVEGTLVGSQLFTALADAGLAPKAVRVLNDTVASLLGGALSHTELDPERCIGLIVGTGTNMAAFFGAEQAAKLPRSFPGKMAINLESGNFSPPHLSEYDDALDRESENPGQQRFEKAVSGYYLPFLFDRLLPDQTGFDPRLGTATLVDFRDSGLEKTPQEVAGAVLARSADLVAAALAAVVDLYGEGSKIGVLAEGSLIWGDPKYAPRVADTLAQLLGSVDRVSILKTEDANLIGSAAVALS